MNLSREEYRYFLKDTVRLTIDFSRTDQSRGMAPPPIEKSFPADGRRIDLVREGAWQGLIGTDLLSAIRERRSHRQFKPDPLTPDELSFLLWATQGLRSSAGGSVAFRTVPSAGCRHALETYLCVLNVTGLGQGIYRFLPVEHQLLAISQEHGLAERITAAALHQHFLGQAPVTFIWTTIPYRMEWRYGLAAHKVIALDAGHVCQNLYLACAAIGGGTCAVAAYHQEMMDDLLGVDGEEEFTLYLAPVGKV
jgi:SagB-type dehydrogenase family enzyme